MKILIVAPFCSLPGEPYFNRFLYLAELLCQRHEVTLVTSRFRHFDKTLRNGKPEQLGFELVLIDEPGYKKNVSLRRLWSHWIFCVNFKKWLLQTLTLPATDVVYSACPLLFTNIFLGSQKKSHGFRVIVDIQDVWPEAISAAFPILDRFPSWLLPYSGRANKAYRAADGLVAVSNTYLKRGRKANPFVPALAVYIGSDGQLIEKQCPEDLGDEQIHFMYLGTLSHSYDLETVVRAFHRLESTRANVMLHIVGGGPDERRLREISTRNVIIHGFLPYARMIALAKGAHFFINPIRAESKASVTNKISDYVVLGKPVLNSQTSPEVVSLLTDTGSKNYVCGSIDSILLAIYELLATSENKEGKGFAKIRELFDRRSSYPELVRFIEAVGSKDEAERGVNHAC